MVYAIGLIQVNNGKYLIPVILKHGPKVVGDLMPIPDNGLVKGPDGLAAAAQFQCSQDDDRLYLTYSSDFQQIMNSQLAKFIQIISYGTQ